MTGIDDEEMDRNWLWLAVDSTGQLAVFQSFGDGALPPSVRSSLASTEVVDEFIAMTLRDQAGVCRGRVRKENEPLTPFAVFSGNQYEQDRRTYFSGVERLASCGVFVYYAHLQARSPVGYYQIGIPSTPRQLRSLPLTIQDIAQQTRFPVAFVDTPFVSVEMIEAIRPA